jgi:hypothetical protein
LKLLDHEPIEQCRTLQPPAVVVLEQVAHDHAAGSLIGFGADELRAPVRRPDRAFSELMADKVCLAVVGTRQSLPSLLLTRIVVGDGEGH